MPVFHTKTIESILDPVAQQVSRLVIIHEEGEAGHEMPDLQRPVVAVSRAVENLVKTVWRICRLERNGEGTVGREMASSTDDVILQQDMPMALNKVELAAKLLEEAASMSQLDPMSKVARTKLIEGSRWILQGTSNVLLVFDESEVRKIVVECKKVLDYLSVAEVIETIDDLVQFVRDLSPCLSKVTKEVTKRTEDLTHQIHREILSRCVEQIKTLAPILICSMKIFIQLFHQGGKGISEAGENRNYLSSRMSEEMNEIIRVLQLTTYDEDEWDSDKLTVMKKTQNVIESNLQNAHDWLQDPTSVQGGVGEKSIRRMLENALKIMDQSLPSDAEHLGKLCGDIQSMTDALCELRQRGEGTTPQAETLARNVEARLHELTTTVQQAISRVEKSGLQQPAPTVAGRLEQARRWLEQPGVDDRGLGRQAIALVIDEGYKIASVLPGEHRDEVIALCQSIELESQDLTELCRDGKGGTALATGLARSIAAKLNRLKDVIRTALVDRVVEDFVDAGTPLKQFTECVLQSPLPPPAQGEEDAAAEAAIRRDQLFEEKAKKLSDFAVKAVGTGRMVAVGTNSGNKRVAEALIAHTAQVDALTPQLINAGRIRMVYPDNKAAEEHFENLRHQFADAVQMVRGLCDEATDSLAFITQSLKAMEERSATCEDAIRSQDAVKMVENTSALARLTNRVVQIAKQEVDNSEDPVYIDTLTDAAVVLQNKIAPMVHSAKAVATNITDKTLVNHWRRNNQEGVQSAVAEQPSDQPPLPPYPKFNDLSLSDSYAAPPRPPPPPSDRYHDVPYPETTDDESEDLFQHAPTPSQGPIMLAAHDLHQEVKQWSSKDNDIIAAAKRMALLMAKLSQLVGQDAGSKRDLIACAKSIAEASEEVTRIAKELAKECTDKRMRTNLLQVCERIPTIATQLKILSTVKATMLGAQGSEEDQEATEMLVGNAQNLMQSVKLTVTAAEAASIKIRTDAGIRLKWIRKQPWYQY